MRAATLLGLHRPFPTPAIALPSQRQRPLMLPVLMEYAKDSLMHLDTLNLRRWEERVATWWDGQKAPSAAENVAQHVNFVHEVCATLPADLPDGASLGETLMRGMSRAAYYLDTHPMSLELRLAAARGYLWAGIGAAMQEHLPLAGHFLGSAQRHPLVAQWLQQQRASPSSNLTQTPLMDAVVGTAWRHAI